MQKQASCTEWRSKAQNVSQIYIFGHVPPLLCIALLRISKVQFFESNVKCTSKFPVAAETIERTFFDDFLTASRCHRCHKRKLPTILAEFQSARNELRRQKYCKMTKIATTPEGPRTDFSSISHPNPQKIDANRFQACPGSILTIELTTPPFQRPKSDGYIVQPNS